MACTNSFIQPVRWNQNFSNIKSSIHLNVLDMYLLTCKMYIRFTQNSVHFFYHLEYESDSNRLNWHVITCMSMVTFFFPTYFSYKYLMNFLSLLSHTSFQHFLNFLAIWIWNQKKKKLSKWEKGKEEKHTIDIVLVKKCEQVNTPCIPL